MLRLAGIEPFAQGGNRLCFVKPGNPDRCIKVRRPDFTLEDLRRSKSFPKNMKPLFMFDDNREEYRVLSTFLQRIGKAAFSHLPRCYGLLDTDLGKGIEVELVRDGTGGISATLKKFIWDYGFTEECRQAVAVLAASLRQHRIPSRDLILHNIVVQRGVDGAIVRLVVVDGLGSPNWIPFWWLPRRLQTKKVERKIQNLYSRIDAMLVARQQDNYPGTHGLLFHDGSAAMPTDGGKEGALDE